jgi:type II secretory pathway component GspD/PulD (secretin)
MVKGGATHFIGSHPLSPVVRAGQSFIDDFTNIRPEDTNAPAGTKSTFSERLFFGATSSNYAFEVLLNFLQTIGDTRLLSNPKLAVINNQEARIHIGRKEAYITTTTTTGQTTTTTAEEVTFVDVGIQLAVTPTINDDGFITMKIKPEVSSVVSTLITPSGNQIPIIDTSLAETTVMVKDNATIIIGGLRRDDEVKIVDQVPYLGKIPFLGRLFRSQTDRKQRSELLVMLTPHIIEGDILETGDDFHDKAKPYRDYGMAESDTDDPAGKRFVERQLASEAPELGGMELKPYRN